MEQNDNEIMVSVICTAYNHEKYIRKALEGFVMQKTNFKYEVWVHDDASTDKTPEIIREYAEKYPDIIKPIFQKENQYSKGTKIVKTYIYPLLKGKYVAFCEGDDCWTDENKLQLQFDAMEQHPECSFCTHYVKRINVNNGKLERYYPNKRYRLKKGVISLDIQAELMLGNFGFQLTSYFLRKTYYDDYIVDPPKFVSMMPTGDMALLSYFSVKGKLYFIDKEMSIYNNGVEGSWTQRVRKNKDACLEYNRKLLLGFQEMEEHFLGKDYQKEIIKKKIQIVELEMEVAELRMKGDYRTIVSKHKTYIKKLSFKSRIKIYISCIFPRFIQWYNKRKK